MVARATPRSIAGASPHRERRGWLGPPQVVLLLLGFALAVGSFIASTLYADSRLEQVARRTHDVSDNALPSIMQLGAMRRELAHAQFIIKDSTSGTPGEQAELPSHFASLDRTLDIIHAARQRYVSLPMFPGEPALWGAASQNIDAAEQVIASVREQLETGRTAEAMAQSGEPLAAAVARADESLASLLRLNYGESTIAAAEADRAWVRTRRLGLALDGISVAITAAMALVAYRSMRRQSALMKIRADELEMFASRVAHDLRSPLQPVSLALDYAARDPALGGTTRALVERAMRCLQRVDGLVQDLLSFARAGAAQDLSARASLRRVVNEVVQDLQVEAAAARVRIVVEDLPLRDVRCAPGVLASIVQNLVANGIKYMPPEATDRRVSIRAALRRGGIAHVEVSDTGAGIPLEVREHVFDTYVRADRRQPGIGLGLSTVRRLVEAHGGKVGVRSPRGMGAVFWFELPALAPAPDEERAGGVDAA